MAAVEWPSHATWNPQPSRMQLDDGEDEDSQDSDGGETPERSHRTSASARSQRVRTTSASTHSGVACQVRSPSVQMGIWTRGRVDTQPAPVCSPAYRICL